MCLVSPLISSANGATVICLTLIGSWDGFFDIWWGWWVGDLIGILLFSPLLILLAGRRWRDRSIVWYAELVFMTGGAVAISVIVHLSDILARQEFLFIFVSLPFALWAAMRFGMFGVALANIAISITAILFLAGGISFFIQGDQQSSLIRFYGYFSLMGVGGLLLATLTERILNRRRGRMEGVSARVRQMRVMLAMGAGALGLSLSIAAATITHDQISRTENLELNQYRLSVENSLRVHMDQALVPLLAIKTLFEAQPDVPREVYNTMATPWLDRNPALQALGWMPHVREEERGFYEAMAREDGFTDFGFKDLTEGGFVPAPRRDSYLPVFYRVPAQGSRAILGFDPSIHPVRGKAVEQALKRQGLSITEPVQLIQSAGAPNGIIMFLPVNRPDDGGNLGLVLGVFRLGTLLEQVFHSANLPSTVALHLADFNAPKEMRLIFSTDPFDFLENHGAPQNRIGNEHRIHHQFYLGGRNWTIILERKGAAHGQNWAWQPWAILVIGAILSGALCFYLLSLTRTEERIARLVKERTKLLRQAQAEAEEALDQAQKASQAKSEFLAHMSHELRSPLNSILGYAELVLKDPGEGPLPDRVQDYVNTIASSGKHLADLIGDILDFSKVEAGQMVLEKVPFDMRLLLDEVNKIMALQARDRDNQLEMTVTPELARWFRGDPMRLRQILMNFLSNATKFTSHGEIKLDVIVQADQAGAQRLRFSVKDNGIGISPDKQKSIFETFTQADMSTTREYGGTGLGLAINKLLVEAMDGEIGLNSTPGEGSEFWFEVGLDKTEPLASEPADKVVPPDHHGRLLVVEDIEINRVMTRKRLEAVGFEVDEAEDGAQAVAMAGRQQYAAILMDIHMPVMDGLEATRQIRKLEDPALNAVPIIALTADITSANIQEYLSVGMNDFCPKPLNLDVLLKVLETVTEGKEEAVSSRRGEPARSAEDGDATDLVDETRYLAVRQALPDCRDMLVQQTEGVVAAMRAMADRADHKALRREAHSLKGVAMNLGLDQLRDACLALESHMTREETPDQDQLDRQLHNLSNKIRDTLAILQEIEERAAD